MSIKKSSIQQALIEAREIEKIAIDKAKKALEEELGPKIRQVADEAIKEMEQKSINEGLNVELPENAELTIKISTDGGSAPEIAEIPAEVVSSETDEFENENPGDEVTPEEINNNDDEMDEIFEIEGLNEADPTVTPEAPVAPEATATPEAAPADAPVAEEPATLETVNQKLDDIMGKLDTIGGETTENPEGEGDVAIIDDEPAAAPTAEMPAPAPAPTPALQEDEFELDDDTQDEVVYEMEDDAAMESGVVYEFEDDDLSELNSDSIMEMFNELNEVDELEIVDEDEEETNADNVDEMLGASFSVENRADNRGKRQDNKGNHAVTAKSLKESIDTIKAQYGSKVDELKQENESLKQTLKEYKESFIVLRKQINEVQIFNAKLAYANKLFTNGGLTNDEKVKIAEEFDKVETIEEAKKLYNNLLSEMNVSKSNKTTPVEKLRSANPAVVTSNSNAQTLYESDEIRRMKRLAGISKKSEE